MKKDPPDMLDYATPAPPRGGGPRAVVVLVGLATGTVLWFWLFVLAFASRSYANFYWDSVLPLLLMALASAVAGAIAPRQWLWGAGALAAPTVGFCVVCFGAAWPTARGHEWQYLKLAAIVLACSLGPAAVTRLGR